MKRGDIVIAPAGGVVGSKPRPSLIIQDDDWAGVKTILVIPFTSDIPEELLGRPIFEPNAENGLRVRSALMVDKLTPARRTEVGAVAGRLSEAEMMRAEEALEIVLGLI